jgi:hypothetical protein
LEFAQRVLEAEGPARAHPGGEVVREVDDRRCLTTVVFLGMQDLLSGRGRLAECGVDRGPAAAALESLGEVQAARVGEHQ